MYLRRVPAMLLYLNWTRVHFAHPRARGSLLTRTLRSTCGKFEQAVQSGIVRSSGLRPIVGLNITDGHFCRFPPKNVASQVYDTPSDVGQFFLGLFLTLVPFGPRDSPQLLRRSAEASAVHSAQGVIYHFSSSLLVSLQPGISTLSGRIRYTSCVYRE